MSITFSQTVARTMIGTVGTALFAGICLLGAAAPAFADTVEAPRTHNVTVSDIDLDTARGQAVLHSRIVRAAHLVCASSRNDLSSRALEIKCVNNAVETATPRTVVAMNSPRR